VTVRAAAGIAVLSAAVYLAVTIFSFVASTSWLGELTTHFRAQMAAAGAILTISAIALRTWRGALPGAVAFMANLLPLVTSLYGAVPANEGAPLRVLTLNLEHDHADYAAVEALIEREQPDVVALTELGTGALPMIERLRPRFRTVLGKVRPGTFEVVLLTTWTAQAYGIDTTSGPQYPVMHVRLCREDCVNLVATHAATPIKAHGAPRARQLEVAARFASTGDAPTVLLGDLNCTPWSPTFDWLLAAAKVRDSGRGRGLHPTWFSSVPFIGLRIDHVLVGPGIGVRDRRTGPDIGSDHFPVIADLVLPAE
jgi:endonuclease/exonuclease/phosphatase (EEP) superfamily protein YafD